MRHITASAIAALTLALAPATYACIPIGADPYQDAADADKIFLGTVIALRTERPSDDWREVLVTIKYSSSLRGSGPSTVQIWLGCTDYYPKVHDQVVIVHRAGYYFIRRTGGQYEKILRARIKSGR